MRLHQKLRQRLCIRDFFRAVWVVMASLAVARGQAAQKGPAAEAKTSAPGLAFLVKEWFAFGSGCKASSKSGSRNLTIQNHPGDSLKAELALADFVLKIAAGGSGVRECAVRLTVETQPGYRIKDIGVKAHIQAKKVDTVQFRSRVLLLVGDRLIARREWDIAPLEFARYRNQGLFLAPGVQSELSLPQLPCGKAQIVGLDFTFEGLTHVGKEQSQTVNEESLLRMVPGLPTELEIFFEKCR